MSKLLVSGVKPYRLAILSCSASKLTHAALAKDLYTGPLFKLARAYAELVADRFVILSARFGLVQPDAELGPYEHRMNDTRAWGRRFSSRIAAEVGQAPATEVLYLGGAQYFDPLEVPGKDRWARPLKSLAIGLQKQTLKRLVDEATPRSLASLVLAYDAKYPGEEDEEIVVDSTTWKRMVHAAREAA